MEKTKILIKDKEHDFVDRWYAEEVWTRSITLKKYFESLKIRDLIIGRIAFLILLSVSTLTIAAPSDWIGYGIAKIIVAFLTVFATVALYWVGKNAYIFSVTGLLDIVINRNFNLLQGFDKISQKKMECVEEQQLLLDNYASDCPTFSLLYTFHSIHILKHKNVRFRQLADSLRFREQLKLSGWKYFLAHFFICQMTSDEKDRVINEVINEIEDKIKGGIEYEIENEIKKKQKEEETKKKKP